jgi:hypothetical protein
MIRFISIFYLLVLLSLSHDQAVCAEDPIARAPTSSANNSVIKSALGFEVKYTMDKSINNSINFKIDYNQSTIANKPRVAALKTGEILIDAIDFSTVGMKHLFPFNITKDMKGIPTVARMQPFMIISKTSREGYILLDPQKKLFYYSGYVLGTDAWEKLAPGEALKDSFCKASTQSDLCSVQNKAEISLMKAADPNKNLPVLVQIPD